MTKQQMADHLTKMFGALSQVREDGQKEYAHDDSNAFANFERVAERMGLKREQALLVFMEKHLDGIHSYVKGHVSQREPVHGRIKDAMMYLALLDGMITESEASMSSVGAGLAEPITRIPREI